jgi:hypothetical protein
LLNSNERSDAPHPQRAKAAIVTTSARRLPRAGALHGAETAFEDE